MSRLEPVLSVSAQSIWVREHIAHLQLWMSLQLLRQFPVIQKRKCVKDTGASPPLQTSVVGMAPTQQLFQSQWGQAGAGVGTDRGGTMLHFKVSGECPFWSCRWQYKP